MLEKRPTQKQKPVPKLQNNRLTSTSYATPLERATSRPDSKVERAIEYYHREDNKKPVFRREVRDREFNAKCKTDFDAAVAKYPQIAELIDFSKQLYSTHRDYELTDDGRDTEVTAYHLSGYVELIKVNSFDTILTENQYHTEGGGNNQHGFVDIYYILKNGHAEQVTYQQKLTSLGEDLVKKNINPSELKCVMLRHGGGSWSSIGEIADASLDVYELE